MLTLAIELSSERGSVALVDESGCRLMREWPDCVRQRQQLFDAIRALLDGSGTDWQDIGFYSVGRGPGSFSGMRVAFSVAEGLALPDGKPVHAVSSARALALQAAEETGAERIAVIGDARRKLVWLGVFDCSGGMVEAQDELRLLPYDELAVAVPEDALIVSPEMDRVAPLLSEYAVPGTAEKESRFPRAAEAGRLTLQLLADCGLTESKEPLYLHPPVFVKPKYE